MRSLVLASLFLLGCPSAPQTIALTADRASALANGTDQVTITATTGSPDTVSFSADGGQLSAASVKTDDAGVATTKLSATTAGSVQVTASAGSATASTTVTFTAASGPHLRFRVSPSNTMAQNLLRPVPEVVVEDGSGLVTSSSASVTVAMTPGSCASALDASSLMTVNAVSGVASFYGLKSSTVASGCTLTATSGSMPSAVSGAFDIQ